MSKKNIQMQVLGESGYDEICPVPAEHASSHATGGSDPIKPSDIGAMDLKTYNPQGIKKDIFLYVDEHATNIPITSTPDENVKIWIDPSEEGDNSWYTKAETNNLLLTKADLDSNGKVLSTQLPDMNYAPSTHASQHASTGTDPITPADIGACPKLTKLTLTLSSSGWDSSSKTQTVTATGILADETKQVILPCPASSSIATYQESGIVCSGQASNSLTFKANKIPSVNLTVYVAIAGVD